MLLKNIFILSLLALFSAVNAQSIIRLDGSKISTSALDQKIRQLMDSGHVTGLAIAVFNHNKAVYEKPLAIKMQKPKKASNPPPIFTALR